MKASLDGLMEADAKGSEKRVRIYRFYIGKKSRVPKVW